MAEGRIKAESFSGKKPDWIKKQVKPGGHFVSGIIKDGSLNTVCSEASCPNKSECFSKGTATFMILGDVCTRNCLFCGVKSGKPDNVNENEPEFVADAVAKMKLKYSVITSVTRDDLPDGGSSIFAKTVKAVREKAGCKIEVLTPDFNNHAEDIHKVIDSRPDVYNHNIETVKRLYNHIRPKAFYDGSLNLLKKVNENNIISKSGIMLGLGETDEEIFRLLEDLLRAGCKILTIGQYLRPDKNAVPVCEYVTPEHFDFLKDKALKMGFLGVASGVFVRSSYNASKIFEEVTDRLNSK